MTMRRSLRVLLCVAIAALVAACGSDGGEEPQESTPAFPSVAVDEWLDALVDGDTAGASASVEPVGVAIVLALENDLGDDQMAELLESGLSPQLEASFWSSFAADFTVFAGGPLDEVVVGRHADLATEQGSFAVVQIERGAGRGSVVTRGSPAGGWSVDLLATLGGAFAPLLFERLADVDPASAAGRVILDAMRRSGLESLEAGAAAAPDDERLAAEVERIRRLLER